MATDQSCKPHGFDLKFLCVLPLRQLAFFHFDSPYLRSYQLLDVREIEAGSNHAKALDALRPQLLAMPRSELIEVLCTRAGTYRSPISAALEQGSVDAFGVLADLMRQMLKPSERLEVLLKSTHALGDAYMNGRAAIINCFLDAAEDLSFEDRYAIHQAMCKSSPAKSNYADPRSIKAVRGDRGERHFEKFDSEAMSQVEAKTQKLLMGWS